MAAAPKRERLTLDQVFQEYEEAMRRRVTTPEWKAMEARNHEKSQREEAARLKWEAENPPDPFELGRDAALRGEEREPPENMIGAAKADWLNGFDQEAEDDEA